MQHPFVHLFEHLYAIHAATFWYVLWNALIENCVQYLYIYGSNPIMSMDKCQICPIKISNQGTKSKCNICFITHPMKCISIVHDVISQLKKDNDIWYCCQCLFDNLPYIGIEDDLKFVSAVNGVVASSVLTCLSDKVFMSFEPDDSYRQYDNENIDPDFQYFNSSTQHIM